MAVDVVVVGAGSAGCVVAGRLSEDPDVDVHLLEAGPPAPRPVSTIPAAFSRMFHTAVDWDYHTVPQEHLDGRRLYWPRGRMVGGSSSMNAMMHVRGNPVDFDEWAELADPSWSYEALLPSFRRSERDTRGRAPHRGDAGPQTVSAQRSPHPYTRAFVASAQAAGFPLLDDVNGPEQVGVAYTAVYQRRGRRWSAADAYLRPARRRRNLHVTTGARVRRVVVEDGRAVGVEAEVAGHVRTARADTVVLCAGTIGSPHLLLLSGIGPGDHLRHHGIEVVADRPAVGAGLTDHLATGALLTVDEPNSLVAAQAPGQIARYVLARRGMLRSNVAEALAFLRSRDDLAAPDLELLFAPVPFMDHGTTRPPAHGISIGVILLRPASRGTIRLASADPADHPAIDPRYLAEPADLDRLVVGLRRAFEVAGRPPLADHVTGHIWPESWPLDEAAIVAHIRERSETIYHPVGTCRMGRDDDAVVDPELRVRGVAGLRVADASVMPTIPRGHTHAPTVAIGERAADLVRDALAARSPSLHTRVGAPTAGTP